jgi:hypothetical protein
MNLEGDVASRRVNKKRRNVTFDCERCIMKQIGKINVILSSAQIWVKRFFFSPYGSEQLWSLQPPSQRVAVCLPGSKAAEA